MHVSLYVKDINNTVKFYEFFFNKKADKIKDDYAKFIVESPSLIISFVENKEKVNIMKTKTSKHSSHYRNEEKLKNAEVKM